MVQGRSLWRSNRIDFPRTAFAWSSAGSAWLAKANRNRVAAPRHRTTWEHSGGRGLHGTGLLSAPPVPGRPLQRLNANAWAVDPGEMRGRPLGRGSRGDDRRRTRLLLRLFARAAARDPRDAHRLDRGRRNRACAARVATAGA